LLMNFVKKKSARMKLLAHLAKNPTRVFKKVVTVMYYPDSQEASITNLYSDKEWVNGVRKIEADEVDELSLDKDGAILSFTRPRSVEFYDGVLRIYRR